MDKVSRWRSHGLCGWCLPHCGPCALCSLILPTLVAFTSLRTMHHVQQSSPTLISISNICLCARSHPQPRGAFRPSPLAAGPPVLLSINFDGSRLPVCGGLALTKINPVLRGRRSEYFIRSLHMRVAWSWSTDVPWGSGSPCLVLFRIYASGSDFSN